MEPARLRLGELLVDARIITREQLEQVLDLQKSDGRRLGTLLVEQELVNETQLTQILSQQLSVPWVSLYHVDFSKRLLGLVPAHVANKYCLVPIYVRHVRGQGDTLYVAMDDPTNLEALRECASWSGLPTRAMIASPGDIRRTIEIYYAMPTDSTAQPMTVREGAHRPGPEPAPAPVDANDVDDTNGKEAPAETPDTSPPPQPQQDSDESSAEEPAEDSSDDTSNLDANDSDDEAQLPLEQDVPSETTSATGEKLDESSEAPAPQRHRDSIHEVAVDDEVAPAVEAAAASIPKAQDDDVSVEVGHEVSLEELLGKREPRENTDKPARRRTKSGGMLSLTLLDGTTLALPVRPGQDKRRQESLVGSLKEQTGEVPGEVVDEDLRGSDRLTVGDILSALRAAAHGADSSETLGRHARWEAMAAAMLAILIRKGVITEEELLEELRRI